MAIPSKQDIINKEWQQRYCHFALRLWQRYKLKITFDEYKKLNKEPFQRLFNDSNNIKIGIVMFSGQEILAVKERHRTKHLRTALPYKNLKKYRDAQER